MDATTASMPGHAEAEPDPGAPVLTVAVLAAAAAVIAVLGLSGALGMTEGQGLGEIGTPRMWITTWLACCTGGLAGALICALAAGAVVARGGPYGESSGAGLALVAGGIVGGTHLAFAWWWTVAELPILAGEELSRPTRWGPWSAEMAGMSPLEISVFLLGREPAIVLAVGLAFALFLLFALLGLRLYDAPGEGPSVPYWIVIALALIAPLGLMGGTGEAFWATLTLGMLVVLPYAPAPLGVVVPLAVGVFTVTRYAGSGSRFLRGAAPVAVLLFVGAFWHVQVIRILAGLTGR